MRQNVVQNLEFTDYEEVMKIKKIKNIKKEGFIILPRAFVMNMLTSHQGAYNDEMAILWLLLKCNYASLQGIERGEVLLSFRDGMKAFQWPETKTRRFLANLIESGFLTKRIQGRHNCYRITQYEEICGKLALHPEAANADKQSPKPTKAEKDFERFWNYYHEVNTEVLPVDKYAALKIWKKMTAEERQMAYDNVYEYYTSMRDIRHARKAYNYLKQKCYLIN